MTKEQILTTVNRIPEFDVGRALTRPVRNPLLRAACGYILGLAVFGLGGMTLGILIGVTPTDRVISLLALGLAVVFALNRNPPSLPRGENAKA